MNMRSELAAYHCAADKLKAQGYPANGVDFRVRGGRRLWFTRHCGVRTYRFRVERRDSACNDHYDTDWTDTGKRVDVCACPSCPRVRTWTDNEVAWVNGR